MKRKQVAVVDNESVGDRIVVLKRFYTIPEAEAWVDKQPDKAKLARGGFGIDAPEAMINPAPISK